MSGRLQTSPDGGNTWEPLRRAVLLVPLAAQAIVANTPVTVHAPAGGKKWRLLAYDLSLSVAGSVLVKDAGAEVLRTPTLLAAAPHASPDMGQGLLSTAAGNTLQLDATASGNVSGWLAVMEE